MYYLATYPEYQERCFNEIHRTYQGKRENETLSLPELNEMRFLDMCIKVSLVDSLLIFPFVSLVKLIK